MPTTPPDTELHTELDTPLDPQLAGWLPALLAAHGVRDVRDVHPTAGEHDRVLLVTAGSGDVVVKVCEARSAHRQVGLLLALAADPALPVPRVVGTDAGATTTVPGGTAFVATRLPGTDLGSTTWGATEVDALVEVQARLLATLAPVDPVAADVPAEHPWSPAELPAAADALRQHLPAELAGWAGRVLDGFDGAVAGPLAALPRQVLHADLNLSNVLVADGRVTGVIDLGDAVHAPRVVDVAVTTTYLALATGDVGHPLVQRYRAGIGARLAFTAAERALVDPLVAARVLLVLALGRQAAAARPDQADYALRYDGLALALAERLAGGGNTSMANRFDPAGADRLPPEDRALLARRRRVLGDLYPLFYEEPLHVVRGKGVRLVDARGAVFLDAYNNVPAVGHANPRVAAAVAEQLARSTVHTRYLTDGVVAYAERFVATHPDHLDRVVFTNSGSEANDLAIQVARWRTGAQGVLVTRRAYHGTTALLAGASPENGPTMPLHPFVRTVEAPDTHRYGAAAAQVFADSVAEAVADLRRVGLGVAALLVDTVLSTDGIFPGEPGLLVPAFDVVHAAGGLVVADEVQPGMGRLGGRLWGFLRHTTDVDLVTCGKPLAGGLPIGTLVLPGELGDGYARDHRYFNTFGGNPVSIAAATAVLDEIEDRGLLASVSAVGEQLQRRIADVSAGSPLVADVRGAGLFIGVEMAAAGGLTAGEVAARVVNGLRRRRVLISTVGRTGQVLKVRPPLVFTTADVADFTAAYVDVLFELTQTTGGTR